MYYIQIDPEDSNKLTYYCRNCGNTNNIIEHENICVSKISVKKNDQSFSHIINKYTKFDPTLPRTNTILCPNKDCSTNDSENHKEREIIYIRYDDINIKYIYICSDCDTTWNNSIKS
jgi:DNA-directed RNA polymerase subunit RPC12/RpoP